MMNSTSSNEEEVVRTNTQQYHNSFHDSGFFTSRCEDDDDDIYNTIIDDDSPEHDGSSNIEEISNVINPTIIQPNELPLQNGTDNNEAVIHQSSHDDDLSDSVKELVHTDVATIDEETTRIKSQVDMDLSHKLDNLIISNHQNFEEITDAANTKGVNDKNDSIDENVTDSLSEPFKKISISSNDASAVTPTAQVTTQETIETPTKPDESTLTNTNENKNEDTTSTSSPSSRKTPMGISTSENTETAVVGEVSKPDTTTPTKTATPPPPPPPPPPPKRKSTSTGVTLPLNCKWNIWLDHPKIAPAGSDFKDKLKLLGTIQTVEGFWRIYNNLKPASELSVGSNYSIFRHPIEPSWEDSHNVDGGKFVITIPKKEAKATGRTNDTWLLTVLAVLGETMDVMGDQVNGTVVSLRKHEDRVSLWLKSSEPNICVSVGERWKKVLNIEKMKIKYVSHRTAAATGRSFRNESQFEV